MDWIDKITITLTGGFAIVTILLFINAWFVFIRMLIEIFKEVASNKPNKTPKDI